MLHLVFILLLHAGFICGDVVVSDLICFNNLHLCFLFMDHFLLFISLISVLISNCIFYDSLYSMLASWSCYDAVYFRHWKHQACVLCRQGHNYAECSQGIQFGLSNSPLHSPMSTACYCYIILQLSQWQQFSFAHAFLHFQSSTCAWEYPIHFQAFG